MTVTAPRSGPQMSVERATSADQNGYGTPRLAEGVDLIGAYEDSGYCEPPSLARRGDGQVVQLTPLLYLVAEHADGTRDYAGIADAVGERIGRAVSADNVRVLVEEKLHPLGVLTGPEGEQPAVRKSDPLLALKFRTAVVPEWLSNALAAVFRPLFFPPVVIAVLAAFAAFDAWLFLVHGVAQGFRQTLYQPQYVLAVLGLVVVSAAFHEIGHAAGCRYSGARPGRMGCGLYLAWPAFYTDVTDAYRLRRAGRLRTDLGGVYFNVVFILGAAAAYALTGAEWLLLVVLVQHLEIAHQLLPVVRLDGYYIVADLTGVPDLFARIKPILASMLPRRRPDERVTVLKPWVRRAVTAWVLVVVPLLLFQLFMLLLHLPRILGTAWDSLGKQTATIGDAMGQGDALGAGAGVVQTVALVLPVVAILLMLGRLAVRAPRAVWRRTDGRPVARAAAVLAGGAATAALVVAWLPGESYEPIRRGERGTLFEGVAAVRTLTPQPAVATTPGPAADERGGDPSVTTTTSPSATTSTTDGDSAGDGDGTTATTTAPSSTTTTTATSTTTTEEATP